MHLLVRLAGSVLGHSTGDSLASDGDAHTQAQPRGRVRMRVRMVPFTYDPNLSVSSGLLRTGILRGRPAACQPTSSVSYSALELDELEDEDEELPLSSSDQIVQLSDSVLALASSVLMV